MPRPELAFAWWTAESGAYPGDEGWSAVAWGGTNDVLTDDGLRIEVMGGSYAITRNPIPSDRAPRLSADLYIQAAIQGESQTPGWASGAPIFGLYLSDGVRAAAAVFGDTVALVDPATGDILAESTESYPWLSREVVRLVKTGTSSWAVWANGRRLLEAPYRVAPELATVGIAEGRWGAFDPTGEGAAVFDQVELGLDCAVPEPFVVHQLMQSLPVALTERWNARHRGLLRSIVGTLADVWRLPEIHQRDRTAADLPIEVFRATGYRDPATVNPAWTLTEAGKLTLVRRRLHVEDDAGAFALTATFSSSPPAPPEAHRQIRLRGFQVVACTPTPDDIYGPTLRVADADVEVYAVLGVVEGGVGWYLAAAPGTAPLGEAGWLVDPRQPHDVELHLLGQDYVLLVVGGRIVDRIPTTDLPTTVTPFVAEVVHYASGDVDVIWEADEVAASTSCADLHARPSFVRRLVERLIPVGGCERNDELQVVKDHRPGVLAMRGTRLGILVELRRLCCSEDCYLIEDSDPAAWILGGSWPDIGPVILDASGTLLKTIVEFSWGPPGLSLDETVAFIAAHLVPLSTPASRFTIALIALITGTPTSPSAGVIRLPVPTSRHFAAGDAVTLRSAADPSVTEDVEVVDTGTATIDVTEPALPFGDGDFVRKVLATT